MAASMAMAMAEVADTGAFEPANAALRSWPKPAPSSGTTEEVRRVVQTLAPKIAHSGCDVQDAEDAIQEYLVRAVEEELDFLALSPSLWRRYLPRSSRRILSAQIQQRRVNRFALGAALFSLDDLRPDEAEDKQRAQAVPLGTHRTAAVNPAQRDPAVFNQGVEWTDGEIVGSIRAWVAEHGRPPTQKDAKQHPRCLPGTTVMRRIYGSWSKGIEAAGYSAKKRRRTWADVEAANAIYAAFRRTGRWPDVTELSYNPDLPNPSVCVRMFGACTRKAVIEGVQRILADPAAAESAERQRDAAKKLEHDRACAIQTKEWVDREGRWPDRDDFRAGGNGLPGQAMARRVFGGDKPAVVRATVDRILAAEIA